MEKQINSLIAQYRKDNDIDTNNISDGYHTFGELYKHRAVLWIALCKTYLKYMKRSDEGQLDYYKPIWRTKIHSDGSSYDGWFLLGMSFNKQITYHLPISKWDECSFAYTLDKAPEFDGHTSEDVLERLQAL